MEWLPLVSLIGLLILFLSAVEFFHHVSSKQRPAVCKKYRDEKPSPGTTTAQPIGHCKTGYNRFGNQCYKLFLDKKNWFDARQACWDEDRNTKPNLLSLHSAREMAFALTLVASMNETSSNQTWIGGSRFGTIWTWNDYTKFDYQNWHPGKPTSEVRSKLWNGLWMATLNLV